MFYAFADPSKPTASTTALAGLFSRFGLGRTEAMISEATHAPRTPSPETYRRA
jgi:hypothetical protein